MERLENFKVQLIIVIAAQVLAVVLLFMFDLQQIAFTVACVVLVNVMIEFWIMNRMEKRRIRTWTSPGRWAVTPRTLWSSAVWASSPMMSSTVQPG